MEIELDQLSKDERKNSLPELDEIKKNMGKVLESIPKLDFPEIAIPDIGKGIRDCLDALPKPEILDKNFFHFSSTLEKFFEEQSAVFTTFSIVSEGLG